MNKNENGFSLVIVVLFMSIAALFIGYLMGSWLISFLIKDNSTEIAEQKQNTAQVNQQVADSSQKKVEEINNTEENLTAPPDGGETAPEEAKNTAADNKIEQSDVKQNQNQNTANINDNSSEGTESISGFGVQIGAFSNYNNALSVSDKVSELGYEVVITDSSPHQVQVVGYKNRDQAESAAEELKSEGYPGFIVIRE